MSSFQARLWTQQQLGYVPHTSVHGEAWQIVTQSTASGNGAAGGTTVLSAGFGGSNDDYNGRYWIEMLSGTCEGQLKRVIDYTAASGTFTLENNGFTAQIDSGDEFRLWQSPEPVVVVDSSSGETNMVDAIRADGDDFWNSYYAVPITGTHRGKVAQITDFTSGTGTFVLAASFGSALAAGDVVLIRKFVEAADISDGTTEGYSPRPQNRVNFSIGDGVRGPKAGTFGFSLQVRPSGSLSADTVAAGRAESSGLLTACGLVESVGTSTTISGGSSTTTTLDIATGTRENFDVGQMVIWEGNATFIDSLVDGGTGVDQLNVGPALPAAPAASDDLSAAIMYRKSTDGDTYGCTLEYEIDGTRLTMTGCKGNVTLTDAEVPMFSFEFQVDNFVRETEAAPYNAGTAYSTAQPVLAHERIAYLSATKTDVSGFTCSPGTQVAARPIQGAVGANGRSSFQVTGYDAGGTWQELIDTAGELDQEVRWLARTANDLAVVYGSHGTTFAARIPVARHRQIPTPANQDGLQSVPNVFDAQGAGTATNNTTTTKVPDFAFHLT